jgi:phosphoribosylformimino-5-aminoimidazole carboxamide ribonucleotide (ProFAR) isomerase
LKPEVESELSALLKKYDDKLIEKSKKAEENENEERKFRSLVEKLCKQTIRPAMEEIGATLRRAGHEYDIKEAEWLTRRKIPHMSNLIMGMAIFPKNVKGSEIESYGHQILVGLDTEEKEVQFGYWKQKKNNHWAHIQGT